MFTRRHLHRSVALLASAGATAALTLTPTAGAHASVQGEYAAVGQAEASYRGPTSGGHCDLSAGEANPIGQIHTNFSHGTKHSSVDLSATYSSSDNSADQVKMKGHIDTSMTLKRKHNDLSAFAITAGGSLSVKHTVPGSACQGTASIVAEVPQVLFTEHKKGYLYLTRDTLKPNSFSEFILVNLKDSSLVALDVFAGTKSHVTSRALLKPGNYEIEESGAGLAIGNVGIFKSAALSKKAAQTVHLQGQFKPVKH
jgi:hypothetical protein